MKKFLKKCALFMAALIAFTSGANIGTGQQIMAAQTNANIVINNKVYIPQNPIHNINDRLVLPFREIGEAMGAEVIWNDANRQVLTYLGGKYSIMTIGSPLVTYGNYTLDLAGNKQITSSNPLTADVAPTIISDRTYIPLRVFAETLGAEVDWIDQTRTAYIFSQGSNNAAATPTPTPTPTPKASEIPKDSNYNDFTNVSHFRILASSAIKSMYQDSNNWPFIFVLYNSNNEDSKRIVPNIQDAAQRSGYRIYGLDMADSSNSSKDNAWLWEFFRENSFEDPTMYFVYSKSKVEELVMPTDYSDVENKIMRFSAQAETEYEYGDFKDTTYFKSKTATSIADSYENKNEFMVVLYDSTDDDSKLYIPYIKAAAKESKTLVYGLDINRYPKFYSTVEFMEDYRYDATGNLPVMFLVYRDHYDLTVYNQPTSVQKVKSHISEFTENARYVTTIKESLYNDIASRTYYTNANIETVYDDVYKKQNFVLVLYNSSVSASYENVIYDLAYYWDRDTSYRKRDYVYGINTNSTDYVANLVLTNYEWLEDMDIPVNITKPVICFFKKNGDFHYEYFTKYNDALKLIREFIDDGY